MFWIFEEPCVTAPPMVRRRIHRTAENLRLGLISLAQTVDSCSLPVTVVSGDYTDWNSPYIWSSFGLKFFIPWHWHNNKAVIEKLRSFVWKDTIVKVRVGQVLMTYIWKFKQNPITLPSPIFNLYEFLTRPC